MTDRLVVDTVLVRDTGLVLGRLREELESSRDLTAAARLDLADDRLIDALDDFATNWRLHRGKITASIGRMAVISTALADSLDEVDRSLAAAAREESAGALSPPGGGGPAVR